MNYIVVNNATSSFNIYNSLEDAKRSIDVLRYRYMNDPFNDYFNDPATKLEFSKEPVVLKQLSNSKWFHIIRRKHGESFGFYENGKEDNVIFA